MKNVILIGKGEVGTAIQQVEEEAKNKVYYITSTEEELPAIPVQMDVMHINIPYNNMFIRFVLEYYVKYTPNLVIINSTIPPGTLETLKKYINAAIVHSPVRGVHPNLYEGLKTFNKFVGGTEKDAQVACKHLESIGITSHYCGNGKTSELAKILSTSYYGWNIVFAKHVKKLCDYYDVDYDEVYKEWNESYNSGYIELGMEHVVRPVLVAKEGGIGGHCISSNAVILDKEVPNYISRTILKAGFDADKKYEDGTWLYIAYVIEKRTILDIVKECNIVPTQVIGYLLKHSIRLRKEDIKTYNVK